MAAVLDIDEIGRVPPIVGQWDVETDAEWIDIPRELSRSLAPGATSASFPENSPVNFSVGGEIGRDWIFAEARTARLALARAALAERRDEAGGPVELRGAIKIWRGQQPKAIEFRVRVTPIARRPARPDVSANVEPLAVDVETQSREAAVPALRIDFGPPPFPAMSRPPGEVTFRAKLTGRDGAPLDGLRGALTVRWVKPATDRLVPFPLASGEFRLALAYDASARRFEPSGLEFGLDGEFLIEAARANIREARLEVALFEVDEPPFGILARTITLVGDVSDRVEFSWATPTLDQKSRVEPLEGGEATLPFPGVVVERRGEGPLAFARPRLRLRVEPRDAVVAVESGIDAGPPSPLSPQAIGKGIWRIETPVEDWVAAAGGVDALDTPREARITVRVDAPSVGKSRVFHFVGPLSRAPERPKWIACIDYGASSTAIWLGAAEATRRGHTLRLGRWLRRIDRGDLAGFEDADDETLLPSYVGLASDFHLRANFDPLSLGDLALALPGPEAAARRMSALGHAYDVSVPFPSRARLRQTFPGGRPPDYLGAVVQELKRTLISAAAPPPPAAPIARGNAGQVEWTETIDPGALLEDVFSELGRHVASRALAIDVRDEDAGEASQPAASRRVAEARRRGEAFLTVVTHPCGIPADLRETYRRAGEKFARGFAPTPWRESATPRVVLAPEALAAAQFGMESWTEANPTAAASPEPLDFVTLDIGAGTFDACVISRGGDGLGWTLRQHFGVALGGADIDRELLERIVALLIELGEDDDFRAGFELAGDLETRGSASRHLLGARLQSAKARLSKQLLAPGAPFAWREGELELSIGVIRDPTGDNAWPVAIKPDGPRRAAFSGANWTFSLEASKAYGQEAILRLNPDFFASAAARGDRLDLLSRLLGEALPAMALAHGAADARKIVIVTGRAALWPPLHARIKATAERAGASLARETPYSPSEMKSAVVKGAVTLASQATHVFEIESDLGNPLAMLSFRASADRDGDARRIDEIVALPEAGEPARDIVLGKPFVIASIMPGLDRAEGREERSRLFEELARAFPIRPYEILSPAEYQAPLNFTPGAHRVATAAIGPRLTVTFAPLDPAGRILNIDVVRKGRVYG
jgi:hypothetical protein